MTAISDATARESRLGELSEAGAAATAQDGRPVGHGVPHVPLASAPGGHRKRTAPPVPSGPEESLNCLAANSASCVLRRQYFHRFISRRRHRVGQMDNDVIRCVPSTVRFRRARHRR